MRIFSWLVRAFVFFALFAFALNNQQTASVRWFFGQEWRAPMVFIVLGAFSIGCAFGVFAMVPAWWRHRQVTRLHEHDDTLLMADASPNLAATLWPSNGCAMDFDWQWLLFGLPAAFAIGWMASRLDVRQWKREERESPKAYLKGLNLLLNEQQDKAIDAFIEAVQDDPDTFDLHFALGSLFRRRGEYERAVRVHEHLLHRADLPHADRERAQHALAQDFLKAGLFDRAEQAWQALEGGIYDTEARLALLILHERSRNWRAAIDVAQKLERAGTGSYASKVAHYWCELALEADARDQGADAAEALARACQAAPQAPRPLLLIGQRAAAVGDDLGAMQAWEKMAGVNPAAFALVATDHANAALRCGKRPEALALLQSLYELRPGTDLLEAMAVLEPSARPKLLSWHLKHHPGLTVARSLIVEDGQAVPSEDPGPSDPAEIHSLIRRALDQAVKPLQRYRCAACGFEAQRYFWQCPGCHNWDTYPALRIEEL